VSFAHAWTAYGDESAPPIVLLHGIRLGRAIWRRHAEALAARYRVIAVDLPGHGALAGVPFTESNIAALLDDVLANAVTQPPLVVGYSLGGFIAIPYAVAHPERTRALVLAGCTLDFDGLKWWPLGASVGFTEFLPAPMRDAFLNTTLYMTLPREWADLVSGIPFDIGVLQATSAIARRSERPSAIISSYRKPVLIINGEYDAVFRLDEARFIAALPQARLQIIAGVEHTAPMRKAGEFTALIDGFAREVFGQPVPTV
jgi:pimeloyl-ACP methyl ester carboxylesterase